MSVTGTRALRRALGTADVTALVLACVVGSGIFLVPSQVAASAPSPALALSLWLAAGLVCLLGALSLSEAARSRPSAGGVYSLLREAFGDLPAFLYGWGSVVAINAAVLAALATGATRYLVPCIGIAHLSAGREQAISVAWIVLIAAINCVGLEKARWSQRLLILAKVGGIGAIVLAVFLRRHPLAALHASDALSTHPWPGIGGVAAALVAIAWTYDGWTYAAFAGGEARDPGRTLPRGIVLGVGTVVALYLLMNVAYYSALPVAQIAASDRVAEAVVASVCGPLAGTLLSSLILITILGSLNAMFMSAPRGLLAMAEDGLALRPLASVHARWRTPIAAIAAQAALALVYLLVGAFEQLLAVTVAVNWLFQALVVVAALVLHGKGENRGRFAALLFPYGALVFCLAALGLIAAAVVTAPAQAALGGVLLGCGVPVFVLLRRKAATKEAGAIALR